MRLDVVDGARIDTGIAVGPAQHVGLGIRVRRQQSVGPTVVVDCTAGDHGQDVVAVATGIGQPLEHQHSAALGPGVSVGVGRERLDSAVGREHPADLIEPERDRGRDKRVDPAGQHDVGLAGAQRLHAGVHRDERGGAGGVHRDRGPAEVVEIGDPVGDDRTGRAGDRVGVRGARVHHRQVAVVVGGTADEHPDALPAQARGRDAGVFQRLPGELEGHPLLRVDVVGLHLRQREELGVEALDVGEVAAAGAGFGDPLGQPRLVHELRPPALGQIGDRIAAVQQRLPHLIGGVHIAGEPGGQADDGDVLDVAGPGPVLVILDGLRLRLAFDDYRRQRLDGGMAEGHRRGQSDPGQVLDVAGHRDRVA